MADTLTDCERAAIAAYDGEVRRIPRGTSGLPLPVYNEKTGYLKTPDYNPRLWAKKSAKKPSPKKGRCTGWRPELAARRAQVQHMRDVEGMTSRQIAERLGITIWAVRKDFVEINRRLA